MRVAGCRDLELGAHYQRVRELASRRHAVRWNRAAMGGDKIHQPEAQRLHARVRRDVERAHQTGRPMPSEAQAYFATPVIAQVPMPHA
jgi:hypothetical protein